jgi:hypothetical protein
MSQIGSISAGLPIGAASWISSTTATSRANGRMPVQPQGPQDPTSAVPNASTGISFKDLQKQIVAAIKDAVAKLDPNANSSDMKTAIQTAVDGVLKRNGIDPAQMKHGRHHGAIGAAGAAGAAVAAQGTAMQDQLLKILGGGDANDPDGDGDNHASSSAITGIGANSQADPFGLDANTNTSASGGLTGLLAGFLKHSLPAGSLFSAIA